jgi:type VI protein secretion system component Hcp
VRKDSNRYQFFTTELEDALIVQLKVERELKASIEREEVFSFIYQLIRLALTQ